MSSQRLRLTATSLLLAAPLLPVQPAGASPAALAVTSVDCSAGPVVLDQTTTAYSLVGACSRVLVSGVDVTVGLTSAESVEVTAPGLTLTASGRIGSLRLARISGGAIIAADSFGTVRSKAGVLRLRAERVGTLRSAGPDAEVRITRARHAVIGSDVSSFVFDRLSRLEIDASTTSVRVRRGSTRVRDTGFRTDVRVHRRR